MPFPDGFFLWVARWEGIWHFLGTLEVVTNMLCSAADLFALTVFLRIADIARREQGRPPVRLRYGAVLLFLLLTPALLFFHGPALMVWTSAVLGIPYLILAWSFLADMGGVVRLLRDRIEGARRPGGPTAAAGEERDGTVSFP